MGWPRRREPGITSSGCAAFWCPVSEGEDGIQFFFQEKQIIPKTRALIITKIRRVLRTLRTLRILKSDRIVGFSGNLIFGLRVGPWAALRSKKPCTPPPCLPALDSIFIIFKTFI